VLALKAALSLRAERWQWCDRADDASFWIVDAQSPLMTELTEQLKHARTQSPVYAALLAAEWSAVRDPVWTFLKVPLQVKVFYQWIDGCLQKAPITSSWSGQELKLKRWPNMALYATDNPAASMQITAACAHLLQDWVAYDALMAQVSDVRMLDKLLADALQRGILQSQPVHSRGTAANTNLASSLEPNATQRDTRDSIERESAWSLVKRLIRKFA
jgi:hypothetical protein